MATAAVTIEQIFFFQHFRPPPLAIDCGSFLILEEFQKMAILGRNYSQDLDLVIFLKKCKLGLKEFFFLKIGIVSHFVG